MALAFSNSQELLSRRIPMAGDPRQCRKNAWRCAELAHEAKAPELKQTLIELSRNWLKLAMELDRSHALLEDEALLPKRTMG
jgi:hypothetical protein